MIGSVLRVHGELRFLGNNLKGLGGGTLYVLSQGQVMLSPGARMIFEDNRGVYDIGRGGRVVGRGREREGEGGRGRGREREGEGGRGREGQGKWIVKEKGGETFVHHMT